MSVHIDIPTDKLMEFCRRHHVRRLALFGSVLREDFRDDSDVDVLVELEPDARVGLEFFRMERELSEILDHKVDLNTPGFLSRHFRDEIMEEAEVLCSNCGGSRTTGERNMSAQRRQKTP